MPAAVSQIWMTGEMSGSAWEMNTSIPSGDPAGVPGLIHTALWLPPQKRNSSPRNYHTVLVSIFNPPKRPGDEFTPVLPSLPLRNLELETGSLLRSHSLSVEKNSRTVSLPIGGCYLPFLGRPAKVCSSCVLGWSTQNLLSLHNSWQFKRGGIKV